MLGNTIRVICLVAISLAVTSVDACGGPSLCTPLKCSYPPCDEFHHARCIPETEPCNGTENRCRCHQYGTDLKCCHDPVCVIENLAKQKSMRVTGLPPGADPASLGSSPRGIQLASNATGGLQSYFHLRWDGPFKMRSVEVMRDPGRVKYFRMTIKGPYQPDEGKVFHVYGETKTFSPDEVGYDIIIENVVADDRNAVAYTRVATYGCFAPACEEAGGQCLRADEGNTGKCVVNGQTADFYVGPGFSCRGKTNDIKCCINGRPWPYP